MARLLGCVAGALALALIGGCSSSPSPSLGTGGGASSLTCPAGQLSCYGACVAIDAANCGQCGVTCAVAAGQACVANTCQCQVGNTPCPTGCFNLQTNPTSCGACGVACVSPQVCSQGACSATCAAGTTNCSGACVNPLVDPQNCGVCGTVCPSGQCAAGVCVTSVAGTGGAGGGGAITGGTGAVTSTGGTGATGPDGAGAVTSTGGAGAVTSTGGTSGSTTGGTSGSTTGGTSGSNTGGASGSDTGGASGSNTGGDTGTTGGSGNTGDAPPGYVKWSDTWSGCAWTGTDTLEIGSNTVEGESEPVELSVLTSISPDDFTANATSPFCAEGTVGDAYQAVALLGFNITEPAADAECSYNPNAAEETASPGVAPTSGKSGIAVNISSNVASSLRIQIQGPNGGTEASDRWCFDLDASGSGGGEKAFAPYTEFYNKCWEPADERSADNKQYNNEPISAVVFLVPGTPTETPYEFCVIGFAEGTSLNDAPDGSVDLGATKGTIGGGCDDTSSQDLDYQRKRITADGEQYIIQNNNWGAWESSCQTLEFTGNSFTVTESTGNSPDGQKPASFPSIYVGRNGDTANGTLTTASTDNLPKQISAITSAQTTFKWSGPGSGDFNVAYDVWFAADNPPNGGAVYEDAVSGFIMLWLYDPDSRTPIGNDQPGTIKNICGRDWKVIAGPRGESAGFAANRPVINYVAVGGASSIDCDLNDFIQDATNNSYNGQQLNSSWYLTDVFAGFEMWAGTTGLKVDYFTIDVQ